MWNGETQNHFHSSGKQENTLSPLLVIGKVFQDPRREAEVWSVERWQLDGWKWVSLAKGGYMIERERSHFQKGEVAVSKPGRTGMGEPKCQGIPIDFTQTSSS